MGGTAIENFGLLERECGFLFIGQPGMRLNSSLRAAKTTAAPRHFSVKTGAKINTSDVVAQIESLENALESDVMQ
jgi:hypothetical protein